MNDKCQRCDTEDDELRTLFMSCGYDMSELELPFMIKTDGSFALLVCKRCRSDWMHFIRIWFQTNAASNESIGSGIFIRDLGCSREVSEETFKKINPDVEPTRFIDDQ